jgi:predicted solute-binding protein
MKIYTLFNQDIKKYFENDIEMLQNYIKKEFNKVIIEIDDNNKKAGYTLYKVDKYNQNIPDTEGIYTEDDYSGVKEWEKTFKNII